MFVLMCVASFNLARNPMKYSLLLSLPLSFHVPTASVHTVQLPISSNCISSTSTYMAFSLTSETHSTSLYDRLVVGINSRSSSFPNR